MAAQLERRATERVGLLGRDDEVRAQLRAALSEAGAEIVHEGDPRQVDVQALRSAGIGTLIVNLDAALEDAVEQLDPLFDDDSIQVVFNESEVTQRLSGWDLARWARHLVSKVLRSTDTTPPPPPGAESLPLRDLQPEPRAQSSAPAATSDDSGAFDDIAAEARLSVEVVPVSRLPDFDALDNSEGDTSAAAQAEAESIVAVELESPAEELDFDLPSVSIEKPMPETASAQYLDPGEVLEIDDFELVTNEELEGVPRRLGPDEPTVVLSRDELHEQMTMKADDVQSDLLSPRRGSDAPTVVLDLAEIEAGLEALSQEGEDVEVAPASAAYIDGSEDDNPTDIDELERLLDFDENASGPLPTQSEDEVDLSLDEDVAALAAQLDAMADGAAGRPEAGDDFAVEGEDFSGFDLDFDLPEPEPEPEPTPKPAASVTPAAEPAVPAPVARTGGGFGELSLLDMDAELPAVSATPADGTPKFDFSSIGLSLAPIEGEQSAAEASPGQIRRVVVLGASIGGPDALRSFLGAIPAEFPALFLLVQHLENGFFARLAQQLQKACALQVRVAGEDNAPARMGEVLVLPSDARYSVQRDGQILSEAYAEPPRYKPCIDDAFRAAADVFGADTLAIIFSGMAGDAVEGASHVTAMGGEVWGQDPASCVVSSMIDGAQARGLLEVIASPRELAEKLVSRVGEN